MIPFPLVLVGIGAMVYALSRGSSDMEKSVGLGRYGFNTGTGSGGMSKSSSAVKYGLDNTITSSALGNMSWFVSSTLDPLMAATGWRMGTDVETSSGYRSKAVNDKINGSSTSDHMTGRAVDITFPGGMNSQEALTVIKKYSSSLPYLDQVIAYGYKYDKRGKVVGGGHMHIGARQDNPRGEFKIATYELQSDGTYITNYKTA